MNDNFKPVKKMSCMEIANHVQELHREMKLIEAKRIIGWDEYIQCGPRGRA